MKLKTIGFIGLGLIGGSIARRIKQVHPDTVIMAYMRTRSTLEEAKADGIVDIILSGVDETLRAREIIILCTPVSFNESYLKAIRPFIKPGCIVTDVGSTQAAIPLVLDYKNHDYAVAAISHVPHVIASSLVNLVAQSDFPDGTMKKIAAGGFKDITRIASSSPVMWEQILFTNKDNIISLLEDYKKAIDQTITDLKTDNHKEIYDIFEQSGTYRSSISDKRGSATMNPEYAIFCDIPDQPGAISVIATLLAFENVSIKNIGINHNREHMAGTIKIEFHDQASCEKATECLEYHHYPVYQKK
mgnify:CR=1 FL=1